MRFLVTLGLACLTFSGGLAQTPRPVVPAKSTVELQISMSRTLLMPGEPIEVEVALRNSSGRTLVFSPNDDWLDMDVYSITSRVGEGAKVVQFKPVLVEAAFKLESAKAVKTKVDVSTAFSLMRPGRYKLTASAGYTGGGARAVAEPVIFHITSGAKLWEQEFGVRVEGEGQTETRKYLLQRLTSEKDLRLYATVTDSTEATIIRQVPLGRAAGNDSPQGKLDRLNYLHVLHHTGPRLFTHTVVSPNGELLRRETYESPGGPRPGLRVEEDGRVTISSAERVPRSDDMPAFQPAPAPAAPLATP